MIAPTVYGNEYRTWKIERDQFKKKYKNSLKDKVKFFFKFYEKEWKEHNQKLKQICQSTSKKVTLKDIEHSYSDSISNKELAFLTSVIRCHGEKINERKDFVGFHWKVTNTTTGIEHYVVGTCHAATKNMTQHPRIKEAIQNTKILITELKGNKLFFVLRRLERLFTKSLIKYAIDDELSRLAAKQKKKNIGLETIKSQIQMGSGDATLKYFSTIKWIVRVTQFKQQLSNYCSVEFWQNGNEKGMDLDEIPKTLLRDRNIRWLREVPCADTEGKKFKGLADLLQNTNTPICIAVGAAHCIGNEKQQGLICMFEKAGLKIERIYA